MTENADEPEEEEEEDPVVAAIRRYWDGDDKDSLDEVDWYSVDWNQVDWDEFQALVGYGVELCRAGEPASRTYGIDLCVAYDLGANFYCIIRDSRDIEGELNLIDVVPEDKAQAAFREAQREFIREYTAGPWDVPPSEFGLRDDEDPVLLRELVEGLTAEDPVDKVQLLWEKTAGFSKGAPQASHGPDEKQALRRWAAVVEPVPPLAEGELPPGMETWELNCEEFEAWLEQTALRWRDTQAPLGRREARALRLVCQFLE
jgi:hypothetical protein